MAAPPPPMKAGGIPPKKYQRGQQIVVASSGALGLSPWFLDASKRGPCKEDCFVIIERKSLAVIDDIIALKGLQYSEVIVAFDIDRTLRVGTPSGLQPRDPNIAQLLESLRSKGAKILALTGAQADCNPANQDATVGAVHRIAPIGLDKFFISETDPPKETIIKGSDFQVRFRGNFIVSVEKEMALDYYLCHSLGLVNEKGEIDPKAQPKLLIFVDDSDANIFSMYNRFSKNTFFSNLHFVGIWFEPTLEQISENPKEADNHQPGVFEKLFDLQKDKWRVEPVAEVVQFVYKTWNITQ